jgi:hypothetical protein
VLGRFARQGWIERGPLQIVIVNRLALGTLALTSEKKAGS